MLMLDMTRLSQRGPERIIASHCSQFGGPTVIRVLPPDDRRGYGIAAVKMRSCEEAGRIARKFGDAQLGSIVLIRLVPANGPHTRSGSGARKRSSSPERSAAGLTDTEALTD